MKETKKEYIGPIHSHPFPKSGYISGYKSDYWVHIRVHFVT